VEAFRHGAFGPDLGYFPGGPAPLSDLAHAHRTGDLCRALITAARSAVERAYAWGWVSHVLADLTVHPLIGCAVGELMGGPADLFVSGDRSPELHGRVEGGLDAVFAARYPALTASALDPVLDGDSIQLVQRAYHATYGIELDPLALLQAHRTAARRASQGLLLAAWAARGLRHAHGVRTGQGEGRIRRRLANSSLVLAYLLPVAPPAWLLASVRSVVRAFPRMLTDCWRTGLEGLGNHNLDSGRLEESEHGHGAYRRAIGYLLAERLLGGAWQGTRCGCNESDAA
jgi:hypothetical protein